MRLKKFTVFDMLKKEGKPGYFDTGANRRYFKKVSQKCYLPANNMLMRLLELHPEFKATFSITGIFLEQCADFPEVLESFKRLAGYENVEILGETYYHSLSSLFSDKKDFVNQVKKHSSAMKERFGAKPTVFRNTETIYSNEIASIAEKMGFKGIITEGLERILGWRSPNYLYMPPDSDIRVLLRNYKLSDDLSYRFSARWWKEFPLTADKYASWISSCEGECVNLFMDYETFGEHQWKETGIFSFLEHMPKEMLKKGNIEFETPSSLIGKLKPVGIYDAHTPISWADMERDVSAWLGNKMQAHCFSELEAIREMCARKGLEDIWRKLTCSDHFYYMCTKSLSDQDVHNYFSHFGSPYEAFMNFSNVIHDLRRRLDEDDKKMQGAR